MAKPRILVLIISACCTLYVHHSLAQEQTFLLDDFNDGVTNTTLWNMSGSIVESEGKLILSNGCHIDAVRKGLIGMWMSVTASQNVGPGQHVNFHLATQTPANDVVTVGVYCDNDSPYNVNDFVYCQLWDDGVTLLQHIDLEPGHWGNPIVFGLAYTSEGTIEIQVNGWTMHSFSVLGAGAVFSHGGARFWYNTDLVEGGEITAEIDWIRARSITPPVVLVHGWRPSSATWSSLETSLNDTGIIVKSFNYESLKDPSTQASKLADSINRWKAQLDYDGKFDIVCHSMGSIVSRWYMEKLGGAANVRQWIGVAPVNHGAAVAELSPVLRFLNTLFFFFPGYLTGSEPAVQAMRIRSSTLSQLNYAQTTFNQTIWKSVPENLAWGVKYRLMVGRNYDNSEIGGSVKRDHGFSPWTAGRTYVIKKDNEGNLYRYWTYRGDGVVPFYLSQLQGVDVDGFVNANHTSITSDPRVVNRVIEYVNDPSLASMNNYPTDPDPEDDHSANGTGNKGIVYQGETKVFNFTVDESIRKTQVIMSWPGSDLGLRLTSPTGVVMDSGIYPVIRYEKGENNISYTIDMPERGVWSASIEGITVSDTGESFSFVPIHSSALSVELTTWEGKYSYYVGEQATIQARIANGDTPVTGASVRARVDLSSGSIDSLSLYDDGDHGDGSAGDGTYANSYFFSLSGSYCFTAYAGGDFDRMEALTIWVEPSLEVMKGWNMVSVPKAVADPRKSVLFPTSVSRAFAYSGEYENTDSLLNGSGYWLKFPTPSYAIIEGGIIEVDTFAVEARWNMIGSISAPVPTSCIFSDPPGLITSEFYGYQKKYVTSDTIYPGKGYWVKVNQSGSLILSAPSSRLEKSSVAARIRIVPTSELPPPPPDEEPTAPVALPKEFALEQNYPNPFNPTTTLKYELPIDSKATLRIFNVLGQVVATLADEIQQAGYKSVEWNAANVATGVYFYRLDASPTANPNKTFTQTKKLLLLR